MARLGGSWFLDLLPGQSIIRVSLQPPPYPAGTYMDLPHFEGWYLIGSFPDPEDDGVGSWLLHHGGEALLLEIPPGLTVRAVRRALGEVVCDIFRTFAARERLFSYHERTSIRLKLHRSDSHAFFRRKCPSPYAEGICGERMRLPGATWTPELRQPCPGQAPAPNSNPTANVRKTPDVILGDVGAKLRYVTASHDHEDHFDPEAWGALAAAFPRAEFIHPSHVRGDRLLHIDGEALWLIKAPKHSRTDVVTAFRGVAMTGDIELGTLRSVNREVAAKLKRESMEYLRGFQDRTGYYVHSVVSAHLNDVRTGVHWPELFSIE